MEPLPELEPAACPKESGPAPFAVGDPVFLHSLTDDMERMNGWIGTILETRVGEDTELQYDVFAMAIPAQYTSDVESLTGHQKWFKPRNLSPLLGDASDGISLEDAIAAGACAADSQAGDVDGTVAGREASASVNSDDTTGCTSDAHTSDIESRYIDKSRTFTSIRRGRAGGLLPPRPALKDARSMFLLGLPCDRDQGASPSDQHSYPVAKARLQGTTLLDLLRRREYSMVWQALLTLLDGQDRRRIRAAGIRGAGLGDIADESSTDDSSSSDESSSAD